MHDFDRFDLDRGYIQHDLGRLNAGSDLFDDCHLGQKARAILDAQSGAYGTPPSRAPVLLHAALLDHYLRGAYYPRGGGQVLPAHLVDVVRGHGGEVRTRTTVERILMEQGQAVGGSESARLSPREREVLQLVAEGYTSAEIGARLGISPKTVEVHRGHISAKLGIQGVPGLVKYAIRKGMIRA